MTEQVEQGSYDFATIRWDKLDKEGNVIYRGPEVECHSYVMNFIDCLYSKFGSQSTPITDTGGVSRTTWAYYFSCNAPATNDLYGVVVGSTGTAVQITNTQLVAKIPHGKVGTQLTYGATSVHNTGTVGSTRQFAIVRTFTNETGGTVTVNEVAIYVYAGYSPIYYFCVERTASTQAILNGETWALTYTLGVTVV